MVRKAHWNDVDVPRISAFRRDVGIDATFHRQTRIYLCRYGSKFSIFIVTEIGADC